MVRPRSQSQATSRRERGRNDEAIQHVSSDQEADMDDEVVGDGTTNGVGQGFSDLPEPQQDEVVKRCLRYMLCRNAKKRPVKRADLSRHMFENMDNIGRRHRMFTGAMEQAQQTMRNMLGMEMVEIRKTVKSRNRAMTMTSSSQSSGGVVKGYILVSVLPQELRAENGDAMTMFGFITVVACMILLQPGCRIEEEELYAALKRIGVFVREKQGHKQLNGGNVKELLERILIEQWYFEREREDTTMFFTLGPRLRAEVADDDLIEFVNAVYKQGADSHATLDDAGRQQLKMRLNEATGCFDTRRES